MISGANDLPTADWVRQHYLSKIRLESEEDLRKAVKDKPIVVLCDETTDKTGKAVFVTLFKILPCDSSAEPSLHIAGATHLDDVNGETTSKTIIQVGVSL